MSSTAFFGSHLYIITTRQPISIDIQKRVSRHLEKRYGEENAGLSPKRLSPPRASLRADATNAHESKVLTTPRWVRMTPLELPVDPEV
ncbi:MAG: hypothetical protein R3C54_03090 [Parvularculaceae bacterium]